MKIERPADAADGDWLHLRMQLWPQASEDEHRKDMAEWIAKARLVLLARNDSGDAIGLVEAALRTDFVNGTHTSPVGFLEGLYVEPGARHQGAARALVSAVEAWSIAKGCIELAADCAIDNVAAHDVHAALGFEETERVVYFRRSLHGPST